MASMPTMRKIAEYWSSGFTASTVAEADFGNRFYAKFIGWGEPFCFGCEWLAPVNDDQPAEQSWNDAAGYLERAHLVPVSFGGDNEPRNLVPLCLSCHRALDKLVFERKVVGRKAAIRTIAEMPKCSHGMQMFTDYLYGEHDGHAQPALKALTDEAVWHASDFLRSSCTAFENAILKHCYGPQYLVRQPEEVV